MISWKSYKNVETFLELCADLGQISYGVSDPCDMKGYWVAKAIEEMRL
jgi:hypothetical protein